MIRLLVMWLEALRHLSLMSNQFVIGLVLFRKSVIEIYLF